MKVTVTITQHELECLHEHAKLRNLVDPCKSCVEDGCSPIGLDYCDRKRKFDKINNDFDAKYSDVDICELLKNDKISKYYDCILRMDSCIRRVEEEQKRLEDAAMSLHCARKEFVVE